MWSKVEENELGSGGTNPPIVQHISSKVALNLCTYFFCISAVKPIIVLCFDNICQRVELAEMLCHMCHRTKAFVCVCVCSRALMRTHAHTPQPPPFIMFHFELALPIVSNAHTVFGPFTPILHFQGMIKIF